MSKDDTRGLTPCPFCGATSLLQIDKMAHEYSEAAAQAMARDDLGDSPEEEWFVVCGDCGAMGPMLPSAEEAQTAWNRRP